MPKKNRPLAHRDDILDALLTDPLADQMLRAYESGFSVEEIADAILRGMAHGNEEIKGATYVR